MNKYPKHRWVEFSLVKMQVAKIWKYDIPKNIYYTIQQEFQIW